jgi:hypothetical protein
MSRICEILERAQQDRDLFRVPPIIDAVSSDGPATGRQRPLPDLASFAHDEVVRLVQRLFLAADNVGSPGLRQVVFCGIDKPDGSLLCARIGRILADQVQSTVCIVDVSIRAASSGSSLDLLPFDSSPPSAHEPANGPARRLTDNLWLVSGDSRGTT